MGEDRRLKGDMDDSGSRRLRWGVLGGARIARICVIPAIQKSQKGEVIAVACRSPEQASLLASEHKIPIVCANYEALLANPRVEAVYIPLPNHLHKVWTIRALEAGKHVLCEKPLALNAKEAQGMARVAQERGLHLMEAFMYRFHPRSRRIKALIDQGVIGDPQLIRASFCYFHPDPTDVRFQREMGGGALLDVGCYGVSLVRWILGEEPDSVQTATRYGPHGVDLTMVGLLHFPGSRIAIVEASFVTALQQTFSIVGTEGTIEVPHNAFIPWERDASFLLRGRDEEEGTLEIVPGADEYRLMIEHFADALLSNGRSELPAEESVKNMQVLDALAQSAREGRPVELDSGG